MADPYCARVLGKALSRSLKRGRTRRRAPRNRPATSRRPSNLQRRPRYRHRGTAAKLPPEPALRSSSMGMRLGYRAAPGCSKLLSRLLIGDWPGHLGYVQPAWALGQWLRSIRCLHLHETRSATVAAICPIAFRRDRCNNSACNSCNRPCRCG